MSAGTAGLVGGAIAMLASAPTMAGDPKLGSLDHGATALGGGLFPFERTGVPATAFSAAGRVGPREPRRLRGSAAVLEARAAALAGDYARAAASARAAIKLPLAPADLELMNAGAAVWGCLELLGPDGQRPAALLRQASDCLAQSAKVTAPKERTAKALLERSKSLVIYAGWPPTIAANAQSAQHPQVVALGMTMVTTVACGDGVEPSWRSTCHRLAADDRR
jgi:hypothetical protein